MWSSTLVCGNLLSQQCLTTSHILEDSVPHPSESLEKRLGPLVSCWGIPGGFILGYSTSTDVSVQVMCVWHDLGTFLLETDSIAHALNMVGLAVISF